MNDDLTAQAEVIFDKRAATLVNPQEQEASYCASGYVYMGKLTLRSGERTCELEVQTGGWMNEDSPFKRMGLCPTCSEWGAYEPQAFPDTAFPAVVKKTSLSTLRTGTRRGFRVPDPPGTGRSALMIHDSARYGSEGCISTPKGKRWEEFCSMMEELHNAGVESIPLHVTYACPTPDAERRL